MLSVKPSDLRLSFVESSFCVRMGLSLLSKGFGGGLKHRFCTLHFSCLAFQFALQRFAAPCQSFVLGRSEEHTSALQSLMRISYAVFCLKKKTNRMYICI